MRIVNSRYAKDPLLAHMLRSVFFITAKYNFDIIAIHTPGKLNTIADTISRNNISLFRSQVPQAAPQPIPIPNQLVEGLSCAKPDWSSPQLDDLVCFYFKQSIAPSTAKTYESAIKRFLQFCTIRSYPPLPLTENALCNFVVMLATQGIKHSSLKGYLSALRYLQLQGIGTDPKVGDMALLQQTIKGIKRVQSHQNLQPRVRLPITTEVLRAMQRSWNRDPYDYRNVMLWAASAVCFFGFFRSGEITVPSASNFDASCHLTLNDLSVDDPRNPKAICINLKQSKTDPFRRGIQVFIGATNDRLCPVAALMAYLAMRDKSTSTPLFKFQNNEPPVT